MSKIINLTSSKNKTDKIENENDPPPYDENLPPYNSLFRDEKSDKHSEH